jgi:hypothetical protein
MRTCLSVSWWNTACTCYDNLCKSNLHDSWILLAFCICRFFVLFILFSRTLSRVQNSWTCARNFEAYFHIFHLHYNDTFCYLLEIIVTKIRYTKSVVSCKNLGLAFAVFCTIKQPTKCITLYEEAVRDYKAIILAFSIQFVCIICISVYFIEQVYLSCNICDQYLGGARSLSRPGHRLLS